MEPFRPLRTGLCVYEGLRLIFLVGAFIVLQPEGDFIFPWLTAITPGALFLLMALFWRLNMARYRVYCPLYIAGKGLSIATTVLWLFFARSDTIRELLFNSMVFIIAPGIVVFFMLGDSLSVWIVTKLIKN